MSEQILKTINIADIIIKDRQRKFFDPTYIEDLAQSISKRGLLQPIRVIDQQDGKLYLISGECRIKAHVYLGKSEIPAIIVASDDVTDPTMDEISENNDRKEFSILEKLQTAEYIRSTIPENRGRKVKVVDLPIDKKTGKSTTISGDIFEFVARKAGFSGGYTYLRAKKAAEDAIPEVVDAMDKGLITIGRAHAISQSPKKNQLTKLNEAIKDPDSLSEELTASENARRTLKRKVKKGVPLTRTRRPEHRIIRVAPDWRDEVLADIYNIPIDDFAAPDLAIVVIECDAEYIPCASDCLDKWGFEFCDMITVWNPAAEQDINLYTKNRTHHIIIGRRINNPDPTEVLRLSKVVKVAPVLVRHTQPLSASLIHIIEDIFPDAKADKRIDMTSTDPRKGWIIWKNTYGSIDAVIHPETYQPAPADPVGAGLAPAPDPTDPEPSEFQEEHFHSDPPDDDEPVDIEPKREIKMF